MTRPTRQIGRGPIGSIGTASSPDNKRVPDQTPGSLGMNDAASPHVVYRDLTTDQISEIQGAVKFALRKLAKANEILKAAKQKPSGRVMTWFRITDTSAADKKAIDKIYANYNVIAGALLGHENLVLDGESTGPWFGLGRLVGKDPAAYVWSTTRPEVGEEGVVQLVTPKVDPMSVEQKARVVIHEVAHRYAGVTGERYLEGQPAKMSVAEAMNNADSYAYFAIPPPRAQGAKARMPIGLPSIER